MTEITFRSASIDDATVIAGLRVDSWRATYRGVMPDAYLDSMHAEESAAMWMQVLSANVPTVSVIVAQAGSEIVGFAAGMMLVPEKFGFNAELTAIYLKPIAQRGGVGSRLVLRIAEALQKEGATGLLVWVIADNQPTRRFFEKLSATLVVEQPYTWDGLNLTEAGYGWDDLSGLRDVCRQANNPADERMQYT